MSSMNNQTREKILNAAWRLLEAAPTKGVRMSDIAKEARLSRQALYLHFPTRAELLVATARYLDEVKDVEQRLLASRRAETGLARLHAFIDAWGNYIPEIYGVAKAFLAMQATDEAVALAWDDRMRAVREGCQAAVEALKKDGVLSPDHGEAQATDILWTLLSLRNWEQLTRDCGWSQQRYIATTKLIATRVLLRDAAAD